MPLKLDVSVPAARWVRLASGVAGVVAEADPGARVIIYGHVADGNLHVNVVPGGGAGGGGRAADEDAVFSFVASLGGSISAEHGIGALKARWLPLGARTPNARCSPGPGRVRPGRHPQPSRPAPLTAGRRLPPEVTM